ncbi:MAG: hypothetical protein OEV24_08050 [Cyclobacteriaceae bacterium]|nr:hypothetical protein [Cyclobacteriaceae bacterium]
MSSIGYVWFITALVMSILTATQAVGQRDCTLKREKADLKVYTCDSGDEKLKTLSATFILENTSFEKLINFMEDIDNYVNWQYNTIESRILHKTGRRSTVYRVVVDAPWPVSDRELITEITLQYDSVAQTLLITNHSAAYDYPASENLVRVPFSEGIMHVASFNGSSLKINYTFRIDPGGSVPAWLINAAMAEGPFYSFTKLKEKLQQ